MADTSYNGHESWDHWNVSLWFGNDEGLYHMALEAGDGAHLFEICEEIGFTKTPDGAELSERLCQYAIDCIEGE